MINNDSFYNNPITKNILKASKLITSENIEEEVEIFSEKNSKLCCKENWCFKTKNNYNDLNKIHKKIFFKINSILKEYQYLYTTFFYMQNFNKFINRNSFNNYFMTINKIIGSLKINWRTYKNAEYQSILK